MWKLCRQQPLMIPTLWQELSQAFLLQAIISTWQYHARLDPAQPTTFTFQYTTSPYPHALLSLSLSRQLMHPLPHAYALVGSVNSVLFPAPNALAGKAANALAVLSQQQVLPRRPALPLLNVCDLVDGTNSVNAFSPIS